MKVVRFLRYHTALSGASYNSGEPAGFPDAEAEDLINRGIARAVRTPATLEELEAEVLAAGYAPRAAKKIAKDRFAGKYGEESRYLRPPESGDADTDAEDAGNADDANTDTHSDAAADDVNTDTHSDAAADDVNADTQSDAAAADGNSDTGADAAQNSPEE